MWSGLCKKRDIVLLHIRVPCPSNLAIILKMTLKHYHFFTGIGNDGMEAKAFEDSNSNSNTSTQEQPQTIEEEEEGDHGARDLVAACSEYLFDLFDANMMEDYHTMERFENRAIDAFMGSCDSTEITFEQHNLHNEFLELFESLIEKFLRVEGGGCSVEAFYERVQQCVF